MKRWVATSYAPPVSRSKSLVTEYAKEEKRGLLDLLGQLLGGLGNKGNKDGSNTASTTAAKKTTARATAAAATGNGMVS